MTTALPNADTPAAFSTRAVGQWRDVISERFVALTPEPVEPEFFRGALQMHERGGLGVSVISGSPQRVRRGPEEIRRSPGPHLFFIHQVAGGVASNMTAGPCGCGPATASWSIPTGPMNWASIRPSVRSACRFPTGG